MFNLILDGMQETEDQIGCVKGKLVASFYRTCLFSVLAVSMRFIDHGWIGGICSKQISFVALELSATLTRTLTVSQDKPMDGKLK